MIYKLHCFVLFLKTKASFLKLEFIVIKKEKKKNTSHKKKKISWAIKNYLNQLWSHFLSKPPNSAF